MFEFDIGRSSSGAGAAIAWYDFVCPFSYVGQRRTAILAQAGFAIINLPFQSHPEIPVEGVAAGPRTGSVYEFLEDAAKAEGLELNWPARIPNSRLALAAAEWTRCNDAGSFARFQKSLFETHFVSGEDLGDPAVIDQRLGDAGVDSMPFWEAVENSSAHDAVAAAEAWGRSFGVFGPPAWLVAGELVSGLHPARDFERLTTQLHGTAA